MAQITLGPNTYDSFASVEFATEWLAADMVRGPIWEALTDDNQKRALITATRKMLSLPWCGTAPDPAVDQDEPIPSVTAELAADLTANTDLAADASGNSNIKRAKAGSAEVEFFSPVDNLPPLPSALWDRLMAANLMCPNGSGDDDTTLDGAIPSGTSGCRPLGGRFPWDWPIAEEDYT